MSKVASKRPEQAEDLMQDIISGKVNFNMPAPNQLDPPAESVIEDQVPALPVWKRKEAKVKTTVRRCIVIDKDDHWHQEAQVDLKGIDSTAFTWGYYGTRLPVLIENIDQPGVLKPWYFIDAAGESSNRLFKGANPDGYKSAFKHRGNTLQKIAIGLMIALVLGLFLIMFILINN